MSGQRLLGPALVALLCVGCAEPAWEPARLEARHPALAALEGHRLGDVRPYYLPLGGRLTLFLCRWPDGARIPVTLPAHATPAERGKLEAALAAWERAGLPLRFERVPRFAGVGIEIEIVDGMLAVANTFLDGEPPQDDMTLVAMVAR